MFVDQGENDDVTRWSSWFYPYQKPRHRLDPAIRGYPRPGHLAQFRQAHGSGFNMAFCDGSAHSVNYSIEAEDPPTAGEPQGQPDDRRKEPVGAPNCAK